MSLPRLFITLLIVSLALYGCSDDDMRRGPSNMVDDVIEGDVDATDTRQGRDTADVDVGQRDVDEVDEDTRGDTAPTPDSDTGESDAEDAGGCADPQADCDKDGLRDCEERQLGTDPCEADTDGDGLNDLQEILEGTDPFDTDTDGDGLDDGKEVELDLDPTRRQTYPGADDGDRWFATACDQPVAEPLNFTTSTVGNWLLALPAAVVNHGELSIDGANVVNRRAASLHDDPVNEVRGFLLSTSVPAESEPGIILDSYGDDLAALGTVKQAMVGGIFTTHDARQAMTGRYLVETDSAQTTAEFREDLLFALAPFGAADVHGLPTTSGADSTEFRIFISVIHRNYGSGQEQALTSVAIAPQADFQTREHVQFRMKDMVDATNIAESADDHFVDCELVRVQEQSKVDFYWVLDQSGSMATHYDQMKQVANQFYDELENTSLDYRLGVANMERDHHGSLRHETGWHTSLDTFLREIREWVQGCTTCSDTEEYGLRAARDGLSAMLGLSDGTSAHPIRPDAEVITIWMSDEEAESFVDTSPTGPTGSRRLDEFIGFFTQYTVGFAIVGNADDCARDGLAYRLVAEATGGSHASLCARDISETIEQIIYNTSGYGGYEFSQPPISSSIRVRIDDEWVPRSREHGFDYFPHANTVAFFGDYRPQVASPGEAPNYISISYEKFRDQTKGQQP